MWIPRSSDITQLSSMSNKWFAFVKPLNFDRAHSVLLLHIFDINSNGCVPSCYIRWILVLLYLHDWQKWIWQVEFRAQCSSTCIRASRVFPELSITYVGGFWKILFAYCLLFLAFIVTCVSPWQIFQQKCVFWNSWSWTLPECCWEIWNISWW